MACHAVFSLVAMACCLTLIESYNLKTSRFIRPQQKFNMSKTFYVTKTVKDTQGVVKDRRIKCICSSDKDLNKVCKSDGTLVDNDDCLVTSYAQVKNQNEYSTTLDHLGIHGSITNLIGYRSTSARALESQVSFLAYFRPCHCLFNRVLLEQAAASLKAALLAQPDIATVDGVVDHVAISNPNIQITAVTPDLYAWGRLGNGSTYEVVGDTKSKVRQHPLLKQSSFKQHLRILFCYLVHRAQGKLPSSVRL